MDIMLTKEDFEVLEKVIESTVDIALFNFTYLKYTFKQLKVKKGREKDIINSFNRIKSMCIGSNFEMCSKNQKCPLLAKDLNTLWLTLRYLRIKSTLHLDSLNNIKRNVFCNINLIRIDNKYILNLDCKHLELIQEAMNLFVYICTKNIKNIILFLQKVSIVKFDNLSLKNELHNVFSSLYLDRRVKDLLKVRKFIQKINLD